MSLEEASDHFYASMLSSSDSEHIDILEELTSTAGLEKAGLEDCEDLVYTFYGEETPKITVDCETDGGFLYIDFASKNSGDHFDRLGRDIDYEFRPDFFSHSEDRFRIGFKEDRLYRVFNH